MLRGIKIARRMPPISPRNFNVSIMPSPSIREKIPISSITITKVMPNTFKISEKIADDLYRFSSYTQRYFPSGYIMIFLLL